MAMLLDVVMRQGASVPGNQIYWGLQYTYPHGFSTDYATLLSDLGTAKPSLVHLGTLQFSSGNTFTTSGLNTTAASATAQGAYPTIDLFTSLSGDITNPTGNAWIWRNSSITAGTHDTYLHSLSASFVAYGKPILVYFCSEMNGNWYPAFSDISSVNGAGTFKSMWQYVHNLFVADGATNVSWGIVYNIQSPDGSGASTAQTTQPMSQFYPGDAYVDCMGLDGFNYGGGCSGSGGAAGNSWFTFDQVMDGVGTTAVGHSWTNLTALSPTVPCSIGSFGCSSTEGKDTNTAWASAPKINGTKKGAWFDDLKTQLLNKYVRIVVYRYYNLDHSGSASDQPYANGYALWDNDSAFQTPYSSAVGGVHTTNPNNLSMSFSVTGAGQQATSFKSMVGGSNHLQGGSFTLATSGKIPLPFVATSDPYETTETAIGSLLLELRLADASKASAAVAADSSGHALNGTYNGTTGASGTTLPGSPGSSSFVTDGTDYVQVPDNDLLSPHTGATPAPLWESAWFQIGAVPAATAAIMAKGGTPASQWERDVVLTTTGVRADLFTLGGTTITAPSATITLALNTWHRIDFATNPTVADGTTDKSIVYVDGVRVSGSNSYAALTPGNGTSAFYVGRRGDASEPLGTVANPATVKDVRIRNIMPTAQQVLTEYYAGLSIITRARILSGD